MAVTAETSPGRADALVTRMGPGALAVAAAIVVAAGALRVWNIGSGIPYNVGPDEPQIMNRVAQMMKTGDFNPHFFDWPTLTFYLNLVVACITFLAGSMRGLWNHLDQVGAPELYFTGRVFTAMVGTATVALTIASGRRWGTWTALLAGALLAVIPAHVRESHYVLTDVPTAFFTTLTLLLSLRAWERPTTARLAWAAAAAGLAGACKYNGLVVIVMPMIVAAASGGHLAGILRRLLAVLGVAMLAFLAGTPYAVLDLPHFLNDYARLAFTFARARAGEPGWSLYLKHLSGAVAWPAFLLGVAGFVVFVRRSLTGPRRVPAVMVAGFTAVYLIVMASRFQIYGRYLLPIYPPFSVMAAAATLGLARLSRRAITSTAARAAATAALVVMLLAMPAMSAVSLSRSMGRPSTIDLAYEWFLAHVPPGTKVAVEGGAPHLPDPRYYSVFVRSLPDRTYDDYVRDGVTYLLAASPRLQAVLSDPGGNRDAAAAYGTLLNRAEEVAGFDPSPNVSGPSVRIYRIVAISR